MGDEPHSNDQQSGFFSKANLSKALRKADALIAKKQSELQTLQKHRNAILTLLGENTEDIAEPQKTLEPVARVAGRVIREFAAQYIGDFGPSTGSQIAKAMVEKGFQLGSNRPDVKVWFALRKDGRFLKNGEDGTYSIVERELK